MFLIPTYIQSQMLLGLLFLAQVPQDGEPSVGLGPLAPEMLSDSHSII